MSLKGLKFYTVNEVADMMQVRVETVLRWIYAKKMKASKLPGSRIWRIREEDILDFVEKGSNMNDESLCVEDLNDYVEEEQAPVIKSEKKNKSKFVKSKSIKNQLEEIEEMNASESIIEDIEDLDDTPTGEVVSTFVFNSELADEEVTEHIDLNSIENNEKKGKDKNKGGVKTFYFGK